MYVTRKISFLMVFLFSFSIFSSAYAANVEKTHTNNKLDLLNFNKSITNKEKGTALGLGNNDEIISIKAERDKKGNTHERYKQTYRGIPIWGKEIIFHKDVNGNVKKVTGAVVKGLDSDYPHSNSLVPNVKKNEAMSLFKKERIKKYSGLKEEKVKYSNENIELNIFVDNDGTPKLVYFISYFSDNEKKGSPTRPYAIIDADTFKIIDEWEGLTNYSNGSGPGGNIKVFQRYYYDIPVSLTINSQGNIVCEMETDKVKTINLNHRTTAATLFDQPYEYGCDPSNNPWYENSYKEINGAYSPLNDVHRNATIVSNMYLDWFNTRPLLSLFIPAGVHYKNSEDNAFWNGASVNFGDGANLFHPLVSLDVVSHEVSHGFTERNSGLVYSGQSGGINESFSDMAGEAAEFYVNSYNDWYVGMEITKTTTALRYMYDPTGDGKSIDHAASYTPGMNVHYSSGVFNKAFYLLSNKAGWNTRKAFEVMVHANQNYWIPTSDFTDAACGVIDSATDLGYSSSDVYDSYSQVGVDCASYNQPPSQEPPPEQQNYAWLIPVIHLILN